MCLRSFKYLLALGVILTAAFCTTSLLPQESFEGSEEVKKIILVSLSIFVFIGNVVEIWKTISLGKVRWLADNNPIGNILHKTWNNFGCCGNGIPEGEFRNLHILIALLSFISALLNLILATVNGIKEHDKWKIVYFVGLGLLLFIIFIATSASLVDNPCNVEKNKIHYLVNRFLISLYASLFLQITVFEAGETLDKSELHTADHIVCGNNFSRLNNDTSSITWLQFLENSVFAITAEVLILMCVMYLEFEFHHDAIKSTLPPLTITSTTFGKQWKAWLCFAVGIGAIVARAIIFFSKLTPTIGNVRSEILDQILFSGLVFYITFSFYVFLTLCFVRGVCTSATQNRHSTAANNLDAQLLRFSMYSTIVFRFIVIAGNATGDVVASGKSVSTYLYYIFNVLEIILQYELICHFVFIKQQLQTTANQAQELSTFRIYILPLIVANIAIWVVDLLMWKYTPLLVFSKDCKTPGPVWAVAEAVLFPPMIFFRFHSAFMCCILFGRPFDCCAFCPTTPAAAEHIDEQPETTETNVLLENSMVT